MVTGGIALMLKSAGIDVDAIMRDFSALKDGVTKLLTSISAEMKAIRERQEQIWNELQKMQGLPIQPPQPPTAQTQPQPQPPLHLVKQAGQQ